MSLEADVDFIGEEDLGRMLREIPKEMYRGAYRRGLVKGAQIASKAAKRNARKIKDTGALAKSIGHKVNKRGTWAAIGARRGYKQPGPPRRTSRNNPYIDPFNYAHLIELGTAHSQAQPYLRPAVEHNQDAILKAIAQGIAESWSKQEARQVRRGRR